MVKYIYINYRNQVKFKIQTDFFLTKMDNKENKVQNFKLNIEAEESVCLSYFLKHESLLNEKYLTDLTNEFRNAGVKFGEEYEGFVIRFVIHIFFIIIFLFTDWLL